MAERKSLGLKSRVLRRKTSESSEVRAYPQFSIVDIREAIEALGGDTSWIEKIPIRLREISSEIERLEGELRKLERERELLLKLAELFGVSINHVEGSVEIKEELSQ